MTVALVWPLNAVIAGPLASAQNISLDNLLTGIPTDIAADFRSYPQLVETRVSVLRIPVRAHISREDLTYDCSMQNVFRHMLCTRIQAAQKIITDSGYKTVTTCRLLSVMHDYLHLDNDDMPQSMQAISRLDVGVTDEDRDDLLVMPVYAVWRRPGSPPFTTYATLLWSTLEQVDLAVSVHTSLQPRMDTTSRFRSLNLTPEIGGTPYINVTPSTNTIPMISGSPKSSLTPRSCRSSPVHLPLQRDSAAVKGACQACEEVIVRSFLFASPPISHHTDLTLPQAEARPCRVATIGECETQPFHSFQARADLWPYRIRQLLLSVWRTPLGPANLHSMRALCEVSRAGQGVRVSLFATSGCPPAGRTALALAVRKKCPVRARL